MGLVSDLWHALPDRLQFDVVTFNPPIVEIQSSDDPDIVRGRCMGAGLGARFRDQTASRGLLAVDGVMYLTLSNAEPLRDIVGDGDQGRVRH